MGSRKERIYGITCENVLCEVYSAALAGLREVGGGKGTEPHETGNCGGVGTLSFPVFLLIQGDPSYLALDSNGAPNASQIHISKTSNMLVLNSSRRTHQ